MRRPLTTASIALALLLAVTMPAGAVVTAPANDDLADAQLVPTTFFEVFEAVPDMTGATLEADETTCDETGGLMDQSIWYAWSVPASTVVKINLTGLDTALTAGIFGPFETAPTSIAELPAPRGCIYSTGPNSGSTDRYAAGTYLVQLSKVSSWDFTSKIRIEFDPPFADIAASLFRMDIIWLWGSGITKGCTPSAFCPTGDVTRGEMAAFLDRALHLPATATDYFTDDDSSIFEANINRLAASGITKGCTATTFCPNATITREQMAAFLDRALHLPATATDYFTDDDSSIFEANINRLAASGITKGCTATTFCGASLVTREQMAAFLHRAFG